MASTGDEVTGGVPVAPDAKQVQRLAEEMHACVAIKDRSFRLFRYRACFVASEAVDWLVGANKAADRLQGVQLGRLLQASGYLHHVVDDHDFKDEYLYFRFFCDEPDTNPAGKAAGVVPLRTLTARAAAGKSRVRPGAGASSGQAAAASPGSSGTSRSRVSLSGVGSSPPPGAAVGSAGRSAGTSHVRTSAIGPVSRASMHASGSSRPPGLRTGVTPERGTRSAARRPPASSELFVTSPMASSSLAAATASAVTASLVRERPSAAVRAETASRSDGDSVSSLSGGDSDHFPISIAGSGTTMHQQLALAPPGAPSQALRAALLPLAVRLRARLDTRDRPYRLRVFRNCFVGSECVDLLVRWQLVPSRIMAAGLGRQLLAARLIHHVCDDHDFRDGELFYRFFADEDDDQQAARFFASPVLDMPALSQPVPTLPRFATAHRPRHVRLHPSWRIPSHVACNSPITGLAISDALQWALGTADPLATAWCLGVMRRRARFLALSRPGARAMIRKAAAARASLLRLDTTVDAAANPPSLWQPFPAGDPWERVKGMGDADSCGVWRLGGERVHQVYRAETIVDAPLSDVRLCVGSLPNRAVWDTQCEQPSVVGRVLSDRRALEASTWEQPQMRAHSTDADRQMTVPSSIDSRPSRDDSSNKRASSDAAASGIDGHEDNDDDGIDGLGPLVSLPLPKRAGSRVSSGGGGGSSGSSQTATERRSAAVRTTAKLVRLIGMREVLRILEGAVASSSSSSSGGGGGGGSKTGSVTGSTVSSAGRSRGGSAHSTADAALDAGRAVDDMVGGGASDTPTSIEEASRGTSGVLAAGVSGQTGRSDEPLLHETFGKLIRRVFGFGATQQQSTPSQSSGEGKEQDDAQDHATTTTDAGSRVASPAQTAAQARRGVGSPSPLRTQSLTAAAAAAAASSSSRAGSSSSSRRKHRAPRGNDSLRHRVPLNHPAIPLFAVGDASSGGFDDDSRTPASHSETNSQIGEPKHTGADDTGDDTSTRDIVAIAGDSTQHERRRTTSMQLPGEDDGRIEHDEASGDHSAGEFGYGSDDGERVAGGGDGDISRRLSSAASTGSRNSAASSSIGGGASIASSWGLGGEDDVVLSALMNNDTAGLGALGVGSPSDPANGIGAALAGSAGQERESSASKAHKRESAKLQKLCTASRRSFPRIVHRNMRPLSVFVSARDAVTVQDAHAGALMLSSEVPVGAGVPEGQGTDISADLALAGPLRPCHGGLGASTTAGTTTAKSGTAATGSMSIDEALLSNPPLLPEGATAFFSHVEVSVQHRRCMVPKGSAVRAEVVLECWSFFDVSTGKVAGPSGAASGAGSAGDRSGSRTLVVLNTCLYPGSLPLWLGRSLLDAQTAGPVARLKGALRMLRIARERRAIAQDSRTSPAARAAAQAAALDTHSSQQQPPGTAAAAVLSSSGVAYGGRDSVPRRRAQVIPVTDTADAATTASGLSSADSSPAGQRLIGSVPGAEGVFSAGASSAMSVVSHGSGPWSDPLATGRATSVSSGRSRGRASSPSAGVPIPIPKGKRGGASDVGVGGSGRSDRRRGCSGGSDGDEMDGVGPAPGSLDLSVSPPSGLHASSAGREAAAALLARYEEAESLSDDSGSDLGSESDEEEEDDTSTATAATGDSESKPAVTTGDALFDEEEDDTEKEGVVENKSEFSDRGGKRRSRAVMSLQADALLREAMTPQSGSPDDSSETRPSASVDGSSKARPSASAEGSSKARPSAGADDSSKARPAASASDTAAAASSSSPERPPKLSQFEVLAVLGRGGYGKVMQVRHKPSGRVYAMKVLRKSALVKRGQVARTLAERDILASTQHPFLVGLRCAIQTPRKLYLCMDFVSGGDFFTLLSRRGAVAEERARVYAAELVLALAYLHSRGIVYRDLKPENVLLDSDGHIKLTDFGLSRMAVKRSASSLPLGVSRGKASQREPAAPADPAPTDPDAIAAASLIEGVDAGGAIRSAGPLEPSYSFCGTEQYMSPECLLQTGHTCVADWWSLGIFLSELLTGQHPFRGDTHYNTLRAMVHPAVRPSTLGLVSTQASSLLAGLLAKDPKARLGSPETGGALTITRHPWFAGLDWSAVLRKEVLPGYRPPTASADDTSLFDSEFTRESPIDSVASSVGDGAHYERRRLELPMEGDDITSDKRAVAAAEAAAALQKEAAVSTPSGAASSAEDADGFPLWHFPRWEVTIV